MKMTKKIIAIILSLAMLISLFCQVAYGDTKPAYTETKSSSVAYASQATAWNDTISMELHAISFTAK